MRQSIRMQSRSVEKALKHIVGTGQGTLENYLRSISIRGEQGGEKQHFIQ